jgi:serine/threonine protein kinase
LTFPDGQDDAMHWESRDSFLATLEAHQLLEPRQLRELSGDTVEEQPKALARQLVQRGWLTSWQLEQLEKGAAAQLVLGQYLLLEPLGQGGMGVVYKARHRRLDRIDAVKLIRKEHLDSDSALQRFYQEAKAAARLHHPNIVSIYDADEVNGTHYMAMEYVAGVDLAHLLKKQGALKVVQACEYMRQASLGLQHAHEKGLVHRDIKPSNLIVAAPAGKAGSQLESDVIKILDMGLARLDHHSALLSSDRPMTNPGGLMGTPDYMAPEQAADAHGVDIRADLYSLGCTFYHLLSGRVPFPGGSLLKKLDAHRSAQPQPLTNFLPQLLPEVERIVCRLLAKHPADRYQTPAELAVALRQLLLSDEADDPAPTTAYLGGAIPQVENAASEPTREVVGPASVDQVPAATTRGDEQPPKSVVEALQSRQATTATKASGWGEQQLATIKIPADKRPPSAESAATISIRPARPRRTEPSDFQLPAEPPASRKVADRHGSTAPLPVGAPVRRRPFVATVALGLLGFAGVLAGAAMLPWFNGTNQTTTGSTASIAPVPVGTEKTTPPTTFTRPPAQPETKPKSTDKTPAVPELKPGPLVLVLPGDFDCGQAALTPDGRWLLVAEEVKKETEHSAVYRFTLNGPVAKNHGGMQTRGPVSSIALSAEGRALLGGKDMLVRPVPTIVGLWGLIGNLAPSYVTVDSPTVTALAFSAQGGHALSGDNLGNVQLWSCEGDVLKKGLAWPQSHQKQEVRALAFTPDGELAISASRDKTICVWNVKDGRVVNRFTGHDKGFVTALAVSPVKPYLVLSGDYYGGLHLWDVLNSQAGQDTKLNQADAKGAIRAAVFDSQGKRCLTGGDDRMLSCWDVQSRQRLATLTDHKARLLAVAFTSDSAFALSAGDDKVLYRHRLPASKP